MSRVSEIERKYRPWIDMIQGSGSTRGLQEQMLLDVGELLYLIDQARDALKEVARCAREDESPYVIDLAETTLKELEK